MKATIAFELEQLVNRGLSLLEMNGHYYHNKSEHIQTDGSYFSNLFVSYYFRFTLYILFQNEMSAQLFPRIQFLLFPQKSRIFLIVLTFAHLSSKNYLENIIAKCENWEINLWQNQLTTEHYLYILDAEGMLAK